MILLSRAECFSGLQFMLDHESYITALVSRQSGVALEFDVVGSKKYRASMMFASFGCGHDFDVTPAC
jgi:hypothetical protein